MFNPDPTDRTPVLVGCDPSMGYCGVAVCCPSAGMEDFVRYSYVIKAPRSGSDGERVAAVAAGLRRITQEWNVERIIVETPTSLYVKKGRSIEALKVLLVIGAVYGAAGYLKVPVHGISVKEWKGAGAQDKDNSVALVNALWPGYAKLLRYKERPMTHDEAEAILLCLAAVQPQEVRGAFGLLKINAPLDRALGHLRHEWSWGSREIERIEKLAAANRLSGKMKRGA
ncbi:MAG: crossover junction endodeoxyribonuclease RuvC [bacterium]|nr:crossover junction endodeoxyribonuclease RuvC [bacterium]